MFSTSKQSFFQGCHEAFVKLLRQPALWWEFIQRPCCFRTSISSNYHFQLFSGSVSFCQGLQSRSASFSLRKKDRLFCFLCQFVMLKFQIEIVLSVAIVGLCIWKNICIFPAMIIFQLIGVWCYVKQPPCLPMLKALPENKEFHCRDDSAHE